MMKLNKIINQYYFISNKHSINKLSSSDTQQTTKFEALIMLGHILQKVEEQRILFEYNSSRSNEINKFQQRCYKLN